MNINKKRILKSDTESDSDENNYYLNKYFKRKGIINHQPMLSSDNNTSSDNHASDSTKDKRRYLHPELNVKQMYKLYLEKCDESSFYPVKEITYRRVFKKEFKLHFHQPRKDACQKCDFLSLKIKTSCNNVEITSLTEEHDVHLKNSELARKSMQEDKILTSQNPGFQNQITLKIFLNCFTTQAMKGEIIGYAHKDIYFLETNTKSESTDLANLFASPAGREMVKYKPRGKLKHKLNPAIEFFIHNKAKKTAVPEEGKTNLELNKCASNSHPTATSTVTTCPGSSGSPSGSGGDVCGAALQDGGQRSRRNSIDLYEEAASILGLTCSQTDNCKCIECQCHYFDFEEELDFSSGEYMVDHNSTCSIQ